MITIYFVLIAAYKKFCNVKTFPYFANVQASKLYALLITIGLVLKYLQTVMISYNPKPFSGGGLFRHLQDVSRAGAEATRATFRAFNPLSRPP